MKRSEFILRRSITTWAVLAVLAGAGAASAAVGRHLLAGNRETLWLCAPEGSNYRLAYRPATATPPDAAPAWQTLAGSFNGRPACVVATRAGAMMIFPGGEIAIHAVGDGDAISGHKAPPELWPDGSVVLGAAAMSNGGDSVAVMLRRTPRPRTTSAATTTTYTQPIWTSAPYTSRGEGQTRPARPAPPVSAGPEAVTTAASQPVTAAPLSAPAGDKELALLVYKDANWYDLASLPAATASEQVLMAHSSTLVVLLPRERRLMDLDFGPRRWRELDMPKLADGERCLALLTVGERSADEKLTLVTQEPAGTVRLFVRSGETWSDPLPLREATKPVAFPTDAPPAVSAEQAQQYMWFFILGLLGLTLLLVMAWRGQRVLFELPVTLATASPMRRLAAFLIDAVPLSFLCSAAAVSRIPQIENLNVQDYQQIYRILQNIPELIYAAIAFGVIFPLYGMLMEYRFGATLGKMVLRLRVVGPGGARITLRQAALRNLTKIIEMQPPLPLVPVPVLLIFPFITRYHQRVGDRLAATAVIDLSVSLPMFPPPLPPQDKQDPPTPPPTDRPGE
jgi:uncharacterized RDD family membrane protein YckC